jgi:hypothetical protein
MNELSGLSVLQKEPGLGWWVGGVNIHKQDWCWDGKKLKRISQEQ